MAELLLASSVQLGDPKKSATLPCLNHQTNGSLPGPLRRHIIKDLRPVLHTAVQQRVERVKAAAAAARKMQPMAEPIVVEEERFEEDVKLLQRPLYLYRSY